MVPFSDSLFKSGEAPPNSGKLQRLPSSSFPLSPGSAMVGACHRVAAKGLKGSEHMGHCFYRWVSIHGDRRTVIGVSGLIKRPRRVLGCPCRGCAGPGISGLVSLALRPRKGGGRRGTVARSLHGARERESRGSRDLVVSWSAVVARWMHAEEGQGGSGG